MKKIMIAVAAIGIAVIAEAATFNWSVVTTTQSWNGYAAPSVTGTAWSGATVTSMAYYFIDASVLDQGSLITAIRNGVDWSDAILTSGKTGSDGKIASKTFSTTSEATSLSAYVLLVNDAGDFAYVSAALTKTGDTSGGQVDFSPVITTSKILRDNTGTTDYTSGKYGWYQTVPEPTSGLLMLLGMAGLALRRRRA